MKINEVQAAFPSAISDSIAVSTTENKEIEKIQIKKRLKLFTICTTENKEIEKIHIKRSLISYKSVTKQINSPLEKFAKKDKGLFVMTSAIVESPGWK